MTDDDVWVAATLAAQVVGRPYRTVQTWARRDRIRSRSRRGTLEVVFQDVIREHADRPSVSP